MAETPSAPTPKRRPARWFLPSVLLGIYLFMKLQGWIYARGAADFKRQLDQLRPALAAKVQQEQLEKTRQACLEASEAIQKAQRDGAPFLQWFSQHLPASVTLRRVELRADRGLILQGTLLPGVRTPESVIVPWAQKLQTLQPALRIEELVPLSEPPGAWSFELRSEAG